MGLSSLLGAGAGSAMTSYFSPTFFILFLPLAIVAYSLTPHKWKRYTLLLESYIFFWLISGTLVIYLAGSTVSIHYFGLWLERKQNQMKAVLEATEKEEKKTVKKVYLRKQRGIVFFAVIIHIGILLVLKYSGFFAGNINNLLQLFRISAQVEIPKYLIPIGLSFFSLQALSYVIDVYRGVTKADDNLFRLALFLGFFPQIVEGPICRYNQTAEQLWDAKPITYYNLTMGLQRFLYGMLKKIVVADRLNPIVKQLFNDYASYDGGVVAFAAICYTVQLYCDFSGSLDAVIGVAQIFGIELPENFQRPFFSKSISEFWKRWHITLGTWFRDYIFYPVTSADKMKKLTSAARKKIGNHYGPLLAGSIALFCVWFCNGLWHGSAWSYIFFGMYHFALILLGNMIAPLVKAVNTKLHIKPEWKIYRVLQILRTAVLVAIGEMFFRANTLRDGLRMFRQLVTDFSFTSVNGLVLSDCGTDYLEFIVIGITLAVIFTVSVLNEKGISIRESVARRPVALRWIVWYALILYIVVFGAYGVAYGAVDPLYAQF